MVITSRYPTSLSADCKSSAPLDLYIRKDKRTSLQSCTLRELAVDLQRGLLNFSLADPTQAVTAWPGWAASSSTLAFSGYAQVDILVAALRATGVEHVVFDSYRRSVILAVTPGDPELTTFVANIEASLEHACSLVPPHCRHAIDVPARNVEYFRGGPLNVGEATRSLSADQRFKKITPRAADAHNAEDWLAKYAPEAPKRKGPEPAPRSENPAYRLRSTGLLLRPLLLIPEAHDPLARQLHKTRDSKVIESDRLHVMEFAHTCLGFCDDARLTNGEVRLVYEAWCSYRGVRELPFRHLRAWLLIMHGLPERDAEHPPRVAGREVRRDGKAQLGLMRLLVREEWADVLPPIEPG